MNVDFTTRLDEAWQSLARHTSRRPGIGIILGSGLGAFADTVSGDSVPFGAIPGLPQPTVSGHSGLLKIGSVVAVMAGRIHYYEGHSMDDVVLPVFLLARLGVRTLIVTNAAGGVNRSFSPGELVLIKDHVNLQGVNPLRGPNPDLGPRFPDMSAVYTPALRDVARSASAAALKEGVYAALAGPSYETPAEIRMLSTIGVDMVGMSTVPEVIAAGYLGMKVLGISCITNLAAGILDQPLDHAEVIRAGKEAAPRFVELLTGTMSRLGDAAE
ncbi:MAG TPA: purine-nucleoside phosphorylase [Spirochaetia bacterium]|nr:purine-nucleoside phosphorylase [Spirochaetia bacterium]